MCLALQHYKSVPHLIRPCYIMQGLTFLTLDGCRAKMVGAGRSRIDTIPALKKAGSAGAGA